jgi:UDP-GlcNAc:undecaprenyl-phosphate/decaprenyl-phosphate GlcNAc-1-phosphate transferase
MIATSWHAALVAILSVLLLAPVVSRFCFRFRLYDQPGPLKIHTRPIPRLGGVAVGIALLLGVAVEVGAVSRDASFSMAAVILVWISGLIDDVHSLRPVVRFAAQIGAGILLWGGGWRISIFESSTMDLVATCIFVALFINAFNFLDGADGLASGVAAIIALGYLGIPASMHSPLGHTAAWSLLGACLAFLAFNFPSARIFLGDSGSTLIGFSIAFLGLDLYRAGGVAKSPLLFPLLIAAVPLLDTLLAVLRRMRSHDPLFDGDRRHFYDLFFARGWTARRVALTCYGVAAALAAVSLFVVRLNFAQALVASGLIFSGLLAGAVRMGSLRSQKFAQAEPKKETLARQWRWSYPRRVRQKI